MPDIYNNIFIGVGGSGGTTLRYLYQELLNGLRERGWQGDLPDCWQFLCIDVAQNPDGIRGDVPNVLTEQADFFGMAKEPQRYEDFLRLVPQGEWNAVAGWYPVPPLYGYPAKGAGQRRVFGRLVAVTQLAELQRRIGALVTRIGQAGDSLQQVAGYLAGQAALGHPPQVWLVSSLGGGSGSGMFLDVSQALLAMGLEHSTLLYTPDVFDELGRTGGNKGVTPNSMAAISELISAFENTGTWSSIDTALLAAAGIGGGTSRRTGISHILFGRQAQTWSFQNQSQVYHAAARGLAAITLNPGVNQMIQNYVFQNAQNATRKQEYQALLGPQHAQGTHNELATSMGYAAVSTGRYAFGTYAAERLVSFILDKVLDNDEAITTLRDRHPEDFVRRAQNFAMAAELFELGKSDQILDAIRGGEMKVITDFTNSAAAEAKALLEKVIAGLNGSGVEQELTKNFKGVREAKSKVFAQDLARRAEHWTLVAQSNLLSSVVASITSDGLGMTIAYLEQMVIDLNAAAVELTGSAAQWADAARVAANTMLSGFQNLGNRVRLALDSTPIADGLTTKRKEMAADLEGRVNDVTSQMIVDFIRGVVVPLKDSLKNERNRFRNAMGTDGMKNRRESLAIDSPEGIVPIHLQPAENEFYLDETTTFAPTFSWLLGDKVFNTTAGVAVQRAANEVLAGKWEGQPEQDGPNNVIAQLLPAFANQGFIRVITPWVSGVVGVAQVAHPTPGTFGVRLDFDHLYETALRWQRERTGVTAFTQITLGEMINDPAHPELMAAFIDKFALALAKSDCMIQIDGNALQEFTGGPAMDIKKDISVTEIPVAGQDGALSTNARAIVDHLMRYSGMPEEAAISRLNGKGTSRVEIITIAKERAPATVYASISEPIAQHMMEIQENPHLRQEFYRLRRARGLASFTPVDPSVLRNMIKGWVTARILGYVPNEDVATFMQKNGFGTIRLFDPEATQSSGHYWSFPSMALRGTNPGERFIDTEVLPALLESMILGFANLSSGGMRVYARLAALGSPNNVELENWIKTGEVRSPSATSPSVGVIPAWAGLATLADRQDQVLANLKTRQERIAAQSKIEYTLETVPQATRYWELRGLFKEALEELQVSVGVISSGQRYDISELL